MMVKKNNKKCIVCGKVYTFCPSCAEFDNYPRWLSIYHDENCKNIFTATSDYLAGDITDEQARKILDTCDLSKKKNFHHTIIKAIDKLYSNTTK